MAITVETFRSLIREGQEEILNVELFDRPFDFEKVGRYVMVGARQAGKSYMLYKRAKAFLAEGVNPENLVYIDFDDERLLGMKAEDFDLILQAYGSIKSGVPILFFDEIQNVEGWEHFARRLANQKYQVFITGSNARMLSKEIHTVLGGRYMEANIFPYSFSEFLGAKGMSLGNNWQYGSEKMLVMQEVGKYFAWGGFPELLLFENKRKWLNQLYEKIVLGDIIVRNGIKNENALRLTYKRIAESVCKPISCSRISNLINSVGIKTTPASIIDYIRFAKEACLLFSLNNYASKFTERESIKKYYFIDNGLLGIFHTTPSGNASMLENLCAIHLYRTYGEALGYYNHNAEVDFYVPDAKYAVQVCWSLSEDSQTQEREVSALAKLDAFASLDKMEIITYEEETTVSLPNGKSISVVPLWKWLLV